MKLYDRKTGAAREFSPEEAHAAYLGGQYGPKKSDMVPIVAPDGTVGLVKGENLQGAIEAGAQLTSHEVVHHAEVEEKYGGVGGGIAAGVAGVARGLTLGLSDVAAASLGGDEVREKLKDYQEAHPYVSMGGEVIGAIAPTLLTAGGAAVPEAGNIARAGVSAARGIEAVRGVEAATTAAKAAALASREMKAVSVAREGLALLGTPAAKTAELGAAAERAVATAIGAPRSLAGRAAAKALSVGARGAVEGSIYGAGGAVSEAALGDHDLTAEKLLASMGHGALFGAVGGAAMGAGGEVASAALSKVTKGISPALAKIADEQAWKALDPLKKYTRQAEAKAGGAAAVGRTLREQELIKFGDTVEKILPRIEDAKEKTGQKIGAMVDMAGATVKPAEVYGQIEKVIEPLRKQAGFEPIVSSLEDYHASLQRVLGTEEISLSDFLAQRKSLDKLVYGEVKALDPKLRVQYLRDIRGVMEKAELEAMDNAPRMGGSAKEYKDLKSTYQKLSIAKDAAEDTTARMQTNRNLSLSDYGISLGAAASGHLGLAPLAAIGHKIMRERGNASAAHVLGYLSDLGAIKQVTNRVDTKLEDGVKGFFSKQEKAKASVHKISESPDDEYKASVERVGRAQTHPYRAAAVAESLMAVAPKTAGAFSTSVTRATTFLASKIPQGHQDTQSLQPLLTEPRVSDAEKSKYLRYMRAVDDPASVLVDMKAGRLSRDSVEAVKTVYPSLYAEMQKSVMNKVIDTKDPLPYDKKVQLGLLLDIPTDRTLSAPFLKAMQSNFAPGKEAEKPGAPQSSTSRPIKGLETSSILAMQKAEAANK